MKKQLTCIICPRGCSLTVQEQNGTYQVSGNTCPKGAAYGLAECTHPTRTITSIVTVKNRPDTMLSVKTDVPIPKEQMLAAMTVIRKMCVTAPIQSGQVLCSDLYGSKLVATKTVL